MRYKHSTLAAAWIAFVASSLAMAAPAVTSKQFIKQAIQGNLAEVQVGKLAQEKGASQGVKDYGAMLVKDHDAANQSATQTAQQMNVEPPGSPDSKQKAVYDKLSKLSGEKFDKEFIRAAVKDHKEDVAKYKHEAKGSGPAADYAKNILPKLQDHLKQAEDLARTEHVAMGSQSSKMKMR